MVAASSGAAGADVSTVKERDAGLWSTLPAGSIARTSKMWGPSESAARGVLVAPGPLQGAKASESKWHSKLDPCSLEEKPKVGVESKVVPEGPEVMVVGGAVESST